MPEEPSGMPTLREVARAANVSISTASRALREHFRISKETQRKVKKAAEQLGWRPSPALAALAKRRVHNAHQGVLTAFLTRGEAHLTLKHQLGLHYYDCARYGTELGYELQAHDLNLAKNVRSFLRVLYCRGVETIVLDRMEGYLEPMIDVDWAPFTVVSLDRRLRHPAFVTVRRSIFEDIVRGWSELRALGWKRIGFITLQHPLGHPDDDVRLAGSRFCLHKQMEAGDPGDILFIVNADKPWDLKVYAKWLEEKRPEIVMVVWESAWGKTAQQLAKAWMRNIPTVKLYATNESISRTGMQVLDQLYRSGQRGIPEKAWDISLPGEWEMPPPRPRKRTS